jgi:predicted nucleic acid-binding protein
MKLIVDTNIVFSGILNQKSRIGKILLSHHKYFQLYSCHFLKEELKTHILKLSKITKKSVDELREIEYLVTKNIRFINEDFIPENQIIESAKLVEDIDADDVMHVALSLYIEGKLWTGDKKLIKGLSKKGFMDFITTNELLKYIDEFEEANKSNS